jgi:hypothetical protein
MKIDFKKLAVIAALALITNHAQAISLDFGSFGNSRLKFLPTTDSFTFINNSTVSAGGVGYSFKINGSDGVGDSIGDFGKIIGNFTIGVISIGGGFESANVTGSGVLTIKDHANQLFTGNIVWNTIYTLNTAGALNSSGGINITGITYSGIEQDLIDLNSGWGAKAIATLQFGFVPARTLTSLTSGTTTRTTTFTGDLNSAVPDSGTTVGLLGLGLLALGAIRRKVSMLP